MSDLPRARRHLGLTMSALALAGTGLVSGLTLVAAPAEAGGAARTVVTGWSTAALQVPQGEEHDLRLALRGDRRAGRAVALQARATGTGTAWTTVDRTTSSRRGSVVLDVPTASAYDGALRVVVGPTRRARGLVTPPRGLSVVTAPTGTTPTASPSPMPSPVPPGAMGPSPTPTPSPTPSTTPQPDGAMSAPEAEVLRLVNQARSVARQCGDTTYPAVGPLRAEPRLTLASRAHARDMGEQRYFSHTSLDGRSPWDRSRAAGYTSASGENIAAGYGSPAAVMDGWLRSDGHCRNIMAAGARDLGVGLANVSGSPYGSYWVQLFGRG